MPFRQIEIPSLGRTLANLMAAPSSANAGTHAAGLDAYRRAGGNCIHLHGEGGETHSRRGAGDWLQTRQLRAEFVVCSQICHDGWDDIHGQPIDRFTPEAVGKDIAEDMNLLGTDCVDIVYLDDRPARSFEPVIQAIGQEIAHRRVRAWGVRNWTPERIRAADSYALCNRFPRPAVLITTEMALPIATAPLWPEYVPFDRGVREAICDMGLAVFAHADDAHVGQCLFGDPAGRQSGRPEWARRWEHPVNTALTHLIRDIAATRKVTPRQILVAWLLNQPFPVIGVVGMDTRLSDHDGQYEGAAALLLTDAEVRDLKAARDASPTHISR